jgi:hypothetical protein
MPWAVTHGMRQFSMGSGAGIAYDVRDGLDCVRRGEWDERDNEATAAGSVLSAE